MPSPDVQRCKRIKCLDARSNRCTSLAPCPLTTSHTLVQRSNTASMDCSIHSPYRDVCNIATSTQARKVVTFKIIYISSMELWLVITCKEYQHARIHGVHCLAINSIFFFFFFFSLRGIGDALCRRERAASNDVGASYAAENKMQLTTMAASVH